MIERTIYVSQRHTSKMADIYFDTGGPPSSPPTTILLMIRIMKQQIEVMRKRNTEKAKAPAGTTYG